MTAEPDPKIIRALISVSDKDGLARLATFLAGHGVEILSTGGTARSLRAAGVAVIDVGEHTGFPEIMDGRVKTLHPAIHGGSLARRSDPGHRGAMTEHGIAPIDLVVVNLYPFEATVAEGASFEDCIESIDIGGPALLRAAAKHPESVTVVTDASGAGSPPSPMRAPPITTPPSGAGSRTNWARRCRAAPRSRAPGCRPCATARTRINRPRSTAPARGARASPRRASSRARS